MCGIVGYVGQRSSGPLLLDALKRLEYRGYDSCGIAVLDNGTPKLVRAAGKIAGLEARVLATLPGCHDTEQCGIGHTRWATHDRLCEENSHPHVDCSGRIFVVHNGIVENHLELRLLPLQLLAYHTGVLRGPDIDKPRNLAKSVTVE